MKSLGRFAALLALACAGTTLAAGTLKPTTILSGKVNLLMPADFQPMSREALLRKYTRAYPPEIVYANANATVSVAISHTPVPLRPDQIGEALKGLKGEFERVAQPTDWYRSEVAIVNGRSCFIMDVRTPSADGKVRNLMVGTSLEGRMFVVSFNTAESLEGEWMPIANRIIQSVKVK
jgi:hypothetical protein